MWVLEITPERTAYGPTALKMTTFSQSDFSTAIANFERGDESVMSVAKGENAGGVVGKSSSGPQRCCFNLDSDVFAMPASVGTLVPAGSRCWTRPVFTRRRQT